MDTLSAEQRALLAKKLRTETDTYQYVQGEPVAIIGMSCRFPGGADSPEMYWRRLIDGKDAITDVPQDRWNIKEFYDSDSETPGKMHTRWGGFIESANYFDAYFFGISPRESASMDPQQRVLLEVAWEALERAGLVVEDLAGTQTGVFIGISSYDSALRHPNDLQALDAYCGTGAAHNIAAGRISYLLDLKGPSVAIDTACSSSLVAVHQACQSLRLGECTMAIAGGINLKLSPVGNIIATKMQVVTPGRSCKVFDSRADGTVLSEGCGVIVLKRFSDAMAQGDPILALVRGSAVNQDGRSNGITAPNALAQQEVISQALKNAGIAPEQISYIETHGTGTPLGDPIEIEALTEAIGRYRSAAMPCALGAVKSNIGHTEAAAGIAGLIKVVLCLQHESIPRNLHFQTLNPRISLEQTPFFIPTTTHSWPRGEKARVAGVSSFGWAGTNAHLIVEECALLPPLTVERAVEKRASEQGPYLLPLSAHSRQALRDMASAYLQTLTAPSTGSLADICYSASVRRMHYEQRFALTGSTTSELAEKLHSFVHEDTQPDDSEALTDRKKVRRTVFVFPGIGSHWIDIGQTLLMQEPVFKATLEECDHMLKELVEWSLIEELLRAKDCSRLGQIAVLQVVFFAVEVALARTWVAWGIRPDAVIGHSVGEVAAAHLSGAISLREAIRIVYLRGIALARVEGKGAMAVVGLSYEQTEALLADYRHDLAIAASNSENATVISGDPEALEKVITFLEEQNVFYRHVRVNVASHSPQMEPLRLPFSQSLGHIQLQSATIPMYSTVTTRQVEDQELQAAYWAENLCRPVLFSTTVQHMLKDGYTIFLEMSPHAILVSSIEHILHNTKHEGVALPSLANDQQAPKSLLGTLAKFYTLAYAVDWHQLYPSGGRYVPLPAYPWQHEYYGPEGTNASLTSLYEQRQAVSGHPLLGVKREIAALPEVYIWEQVISLTALPYLADHCVQKQVVFPAAAYLEMALAASQQIPGVGSLTLEDVYFQNTLILKKGEKYALQCVFSYTGTDCITFQIFSRVNQQAASWIEHVKGSLRSYLNDDAMPALETPVELCKRYGYSASGEQHYAFLREQGLEYGPRFQRVKRLWRSSNEGIAELDPVECEPYYIHPVLLDATLQVMANLVAEAAPHRGLSGAAMPVYLQHFHIFDASFDKAWSKAVIWETDGIYTGNISLLGQDGQVLAEASGLRVHLLEHRPMTTQTAKMEDWLYELNWEPSPSSPTHEYTRRPERGTWLLFTDEERYGAALLEQATQRNIPCIMVTPGEAYRQFSSRHFCIRPDQREDIHMLLHVIQEECAANCSGIIHLWSLGITQEEASRYRNIAWGCGSMLHIVQELVDRDREQFPALWLCTQGVYAIGADDMQAEAVAQSPSWGLYRAIIEEHPELPCSIVDLEANADSTETAKALWARIEQKAGKEQLALRQGQYYLPRLTRYLRQNHKAQPLAFRADASYLITGGLGGIGLELSRWMVEQGARRLILLGRTPLPPRAEWSQLDQASIAGQQIKTIRALESLGASIHLAAVDIGNNEELSAFITAFKREAWPAIRGVFHAAGVGQEHAVSELDIATLQAEFHPKVTGSWLLHRLFAQETLDFFVLFSSASALISPVYLGSYAAANSYLDALARYRRAQGLPALSVNWGEWAGVGMAARSARKRLKKETLAPRGMQSLSPQQGLAVLKHLLQSHATQVAVMPIDWREWFRFHPGEARTQSLVSHFADTTAHIPEEKQYGDLLVALQSKEAFATRPEEYLQHLMQLLREVVAQILKIPEAHLDIHRPLNAMGMDSLMNVDLRNRLYALLQVSVPIVRLLQSPSIAQIAQMLYDQLLANTIAASALGSIDEQGEKEMEEFAL